MSDCRASLLPNALSDEREQFFLLVGFAEKVIDANLESIVAVFFRRARGNHDDRNVMEPFIGADVTRQIKTVHPRHFYVDEHDVGFGFDQLFKRIDPVFSGQYMITFARQQASGNLAYGQ